MIQQIGAQGWYQSWIKLILRWNKSWVGKPRQPTTRTDSWLKSNHEWHKVNDIINAHIYLFSNLPLGWSTYRVNCTLALCKRYHSDSYHLIHQLNNMLTRFFCFEKYLLQLSLITSYLDCFMLWLQTNCIKHVKNFSCFSHLWWCPWRQFRYVRVGNAISW